MRQFAVFGVKTMAIAARFDLTMDANDKEVVSRAAALAGTTMAAFVRAAVKEKARELLDRESRVTLSARDFEAITQALNAAFQPNAALQGALVAAGKISRA
jgi:uncharacterized protein (DUF1778 family)